MNNSPPPAVPRMDEGLERLLTHAYGAAADLHEKRGKWKLEIWSEADYAEQSRLAEAVDVAWSALRLRISQLISEARAEGRTQPCAVCTSTSEWPL